MTIGDRIRERREELGWSQEELAHKLGLRGRSSVSKAEKSGDTMTSTLIKAYAEALQTSTAYLLGFEDNSEKYSYVHETMNLMLDPKQQDLVKTLDALNEIEKDELLTYAKFLISKRAPNGAP